MVRLGLFRRNYWLMVLLASQLVLSGCGGSKEGAKEPDDCESGSALIEGECLSEQTVACAVVTPPANAHQVDAEVTIGYTDEDGWAAAAECEWECNADYALVGEGCLKEQKVACASIEPPSNAHQVDEEVTILYTGSGGWTEAAECAWECDQDFALVEEACIAEQAVLCLDVLPPDNAHQVDAEVTITYTDAGGWSLAEQCGWECDADFDLVEDACISEQAAPCAPIEPPSNAHEVESEETITYTDAEGWTVAADCDWECDADFDLVEEACLNEQSVPCLDIEVPGNGHQVDAQVIITYTDADGWTVAADCQWECNSDFELNNDKCINQQTVPCGAIEAPSNAHQIDGEVTINYTDADGWTVAADCAWDCDADFELADAACINEQTVPCSDIEAPANAHQVDGEVTVTYTDAEGWTVAADCAWECDADFDLVADACINEQTVPCTDIQAPANAHQVDGDVPITYTDVGGWTVADDCTWECDADFDLVADACIDAQQVPCADVAAPANAHQIDGDVTITFTDGGGWTVPVECAWECNADFDHMVGACVDDQSVDCADIIPPDYAHQVEEPVTITYTDVGGWTEPAECGWDCDVGFLSSDGSACDLCDNDSGYWDFGFDEVCSESSWVDQGTELGEGDQVEIVSDGLGGVIVVWEASTPGNPDIRAQRVGPDGAPANGWPEAGAPVCTDAESQLEPALATDGAGGAIIVWRDGRGVTSSYYAARVLSDGTMDPDWPADGLLIYEGVEYENLLRPMIAADGDGGAYIVWRGYPGASQSMSYIMIHRVAGDGTFPTGWEEVKPLSVVGYNSVPFVVPDDEGGAWVTWTGNNVCRVTRVAADGAMAPGWGGNGIAIAEGKAPYCEPPAPDGQGGLLLAFTANMIPWVTGADIFVQKVNPDGSLEWPPYTDFGGVKVSAGQFHETVPSVVSDGLGGAFLAWEDARAGVDVSDNSMHEIYGAHVLASGALDPAWPDYWLQLSSADTGFHQIPQVIADGAGGFYVAWHRTDVSGTGEAEIRVVRVTADGELAPAWELGGVTLYDVQGNSGALPRLASDGGNGAFVAWQTSAGFDLIVMVQRIFSDGVVPKE